MGGKSCLGRQLGLIAIMAQTGCFVPAESATLPCLDALFVRVGARDDLHAKKSTLLVEMEEAALVISRATSRSLVLMDELGRGTDVTDGAAIAKSVLKNLVEETKCLTVFITHYKAVTEMEDELEGGKVGNGYMGYLRQEGDAIGDVLFLYKLTLGRSADSFGMNVARMAGISDDDVRVAVEKGQVDKLFQDLTY